MRNAGWYVPYWRKPLRRGQFEQVPSENEPQILRDDAQLDAVRRRWIERYRRTTRALAVFSLSIGAGRTEVQAHYDLKRREGSVPYRELEDAYQHLLRVLPSSSRRKKRIRGRRPYGSPQSVQSSNSTGATQGYSVDHSDESSEEDSELNSFGDDAEADE